MKGAARYSYIINLKLGVGEHLKIMQDAYPGVADVNLASRDFFDYNECITSCKQLVADVQAKANKENTAGISYMVSSEVNPVHTVTPTLSRDWSVGELARMWVFDKKMEGTDTIVAITQARIFKTEAPTAGVPLLN